MTKDLIVKLMSYPFERRALLEEDALRILNDPKLETLSLVYAAYQVRRKYFDREVTVHIINNVQNGMCPEDCRYCAQSTSSKVQIEEYPMKSEKEILAEAGAAYEQGAFRYCMVMSGTGPSDDRVEKIARVVREIKSRYAIEVCVSPGVITFQQAKMLKEAGLDRLNHNLNTSRKHYSKICTTHTFEDRLATLLAARDVGLKVCSGVIVGMGELPEDIIDLALKLRDLKAESIPVNFLIPIPGIALKEAVGLTPDHCLRVLCLFRFLNPKAEIRIAAGREMHLRGLEALGLYVANSIFLQGYLNVKGSPDIRTLQMIKDLGFTIKSEVNLDDILQMAGDNRASMQLKRAEDLRPYRI
jgi:biotin synthase